MSWIDCSNCLEHLDKKYTDYPELLTGSIGRNYAINRSVGDNKMLKSGSMPSKFQSADDGASFSSGRLVYKKNHQYRKRFDNKLLKRAKSLPYSSSYKGGKLIGTDGDNRSSSSYIESKRNNAIGKSTHKIAPNPKRIAFAKMNDNDSNRARRRARSGGYVAPPKKGLIKDRVSCSY